MIKKAFIFTLMVFCFVLLFCSISVSVVNCVKVYGGGNYWYECDGVRVTQITGDDYIKDFKVIGDRAVWWYGRQGSGTTTYWDYAYYSNSVYGGTIVKITQQATGTCGAHGCSGDSRSIKDFKISGDRAVWQYGYWGTYHGYAYYSNSLSGGAIVRVTQLAENSYSIRNFKITVDRPNRATWQYGYWGTYYGYAYYYDCLTGGNMERITQLAESPYYISDFRISGDQATWKYCVGFSCTSHSKTLRDCMPCISHSYYSCHDNDVYWYDSCDQVEERKEECGSDGCDTWGANYCLYNDVYHTRTCHYRGCSGSSCYDNTYTQEEKVEECGTSGYTGSNYCYDNDVYRDYINRGCSGGSCTSSTERMKIWECGTAGCSGGACCLSHSYYACYDNDVHWFSSCDMRQEMKEECAPNEVCEDGQCVLVLEGDVNGDCTVDILDLASVGVSYGSQSGDPNWNPDADLNGDNRIDIFDLATVGLNYGRTC